MKLTEYTGARAEALYRMAIPETDSPLDIRLLWFDNLSADDILKRINPDIHMHSFYEIHFVLSGSASYEIKGNTVEISESYALLITPETAHRYIGGSSDFYKATAAFSAGTKVSELFGDMRHAVFEFPESVTDNIGFMLRSSDCIDVFAPSIICGRIYEIIRIAFNALDIKLPEAEETDTDPRVIAAMEFIKRNKHMSISCADVAGECCLSAKQLGRVFRNSTGISIYEYITDTRIKYAKKLLSDSERSIKEIALDMGFATPSSFASFFKRHCGLSPGEFRLYGRG